MDSRATADPAGSSSTTSLRKRVLSIDTLSRGGEPAPSRGRPERESKARRQQEEGAMASDQAAAEPVSPAGRLFQETHFNCYIVAVIGLGARVDVEAARAGLEATLVRHPRFCSAQVRTHARTHAVTRPTPSFPTSQLAPKKSSRLVGNLGCCIWFLSPRLPRERAHAVDSQALRG